MFRSVIKSVQDVSGDPKRIGTAEPSPASWAPTLVTATVVIVAFVVYAVVADDVTSPHVFSDELLYFDAAGSVVEGDGLAMRSEPYRYSPLYPGLLAALFTLVPDRIAAYELAKTLNALIFALTAVPVFLLARRLLAPWPSAVVAVLSVAIPSSIYVSVVMTESLAYLAAAWAFYALVLVFERPTAVRQLAALCAILIASGVRTQFLALFGIYVVGLAIVALTLPTCRGHTKAMLITLWPTGAVLTVGIMLGLFVAGADVPRDALGAYSELWRAYDLTEVGRWLVYHLANMDLYLAVIPFAVAPAVVAELFVRARRGSETHAAFLALFVASNGVLLTLTAAFNTTEFAGNRLHDRTVFYVIPLWMIVLLVWVVEGAPRPLVAAGCGVAFAVALPLFLPFSDYLRDDARLQFNAVVTTLWASVDRAGADVDVSARVVLVPFTVLLALSAFVLPVTRRYLLPVLVFAVLGMTTVLSWSNAWRVADPWALALAREDRSWLDELVPKGASVTLLAVRAPCTKLLDTQGYYLTEFFNTSVRHLAQTGTPPDSLPSLTVRVSSKGEFLLPSGDLLHADHVVTPPGVRLAGQRIGEGTTARLTLWDVGGAVRALGVGSNNELKAATCGGLR